eukprot:gene27655-7293_t
MALGGPGPKHKSAKPGLVAETLARLIIIFPSEAHSRVSAANQGMKMFPVLEIAKSEVANSESRATHPPVEILRKSTCISKDAISKGCGHVEQQHCPKIENELEESKKVLESLRLVNECANITLNFAKRLNEEHASNLASYKQSMKVKEAVGVELYERMVQRGSSNCPVDKITLTRKSFMLVRMRFKELDEIVARALASSKSMTMTEETHAESDVKEKKEVRAVEVKLHEQVVHPSSRSSQLRLDVERVEIECESVIRQMKARVAKGLAYAKQSLESCHVQVQELKQCYAEEMEEEVKEAAGAKLHEKGIQQSDSSNHLVGNIRLGIHYADRISDGLRRLSEETASRRASTKETLARGLAQCGAVGQNYAKSMTSAEETWVEYDVKGIKDVEEAVEVKLQKGIQQSGSSDNVMGNIRLAIDYADSFSDRMGRLSEETARRRASTKETLERELTQLEAVRLGHAKSTTSVEQTRAESDVTEKKDLEEVVEVKLHEKGIQQSTNPKQGRLENLSLAIERADRVLAGPRRLIEEQASRHASSTQHLEGYRSQREALRQHYAKPSTSTKQEGEEKVEVVNVEAVRQAEVVVQEEVQAVEEVEVEVESVKEVVKKVKKERGVKKLHIDAGNAYCMIPPMA